MKTGNVEFDQFKKGMYRGQAMVYARIADWLEEDLREGRSIDRYVEFFRKESAHCAEIADGMDEPLTSATDAGTRLTRGADLESGYRESHYRPIKTPDSTRGLRGPTTRPRKSGTAIGESHWQTMCAIREANKGGISEIANLDSEMAKLTSEATDIPVAHLTGESLRKKLQEVRESIAQHKKVEQILIGMMGNDTDCRNIAVAAVSDRQIRKGKRAA